MQRYFLKESYEPKDHFILKGETYHHIVQIFQQKDWYAIILKKPEVE